MISEADYLGRLQAFKDRKDREKKEKEEEFAAIKKKKEAKKKKLEQKRSKSLDRDTAGKDGEDAPRRTKKRPVRSKSTLPQVMDVTIPDKSTKSNNESKTEAVPKVEDVSKTERKRPVASPQVTSVTIVDKSTKSKNESKAEAVPKLEEISSMGKTRPIRPPQVTGVTIVDKSTKPNDLSKAVAEPKVEEVAKMGRTRPVRPPKVTGVTLVAKSTTKSNNESNADTEPKMEEVAKTGGTRPVRPPQITGVTSTESSRGRGRNRPTDDNSGDDEEPPKPTKPSEKLQESWRCRVAVLGGAELGYTSQSVRTTMANLGNASKSTQDTNSNLLHGSISMDDNSRLQNKLNASFKKDVNAALNQLTKEEEIDNRRRGGKDGLRQKGISARDKKSDSEGAKYHPGSLRMLQKRGKRKTGQDATDDESVTSAASQSSIFKPKTSKVSAAEWNELSNHGGKPDFIVEKSTLFTPTQTDHDDSSLSDVSGINASVNSFGGDDNLEGSLSVLDLMDAKDHDDSDDEEQNNENRRRHKSGDSIRHGSRARVKRIGDSRGASADDDDDDDDDEYSPGGRESNYRAKSVRGGSRNEKVSRAQRNKRRGSYFDSSERSQELKFGRSKTHDGSMRGINASRSKWDNGGGEESSRRGREGRNSYRVPGDEYEEDYGGSYLDGGGSRHGYRARSADGGPRAERSHPRGSMMTRTKSHDGSAGDFNSSRSKWSSRSGHDDRDSRREYRSNRGGRLAAGGELSGSRHGDRSSRHGPPTAGGELAGSHSGGYNSSQRSQRCLDGDLNGSLSGSRRGRRTGGRDLNSSLSGSQHGDMNGSKRGCRTGEDLNGSGSGSQRGRRTGGDMNTVVSGSRHGSQRKHRTADRNLNGSRRGGRMTASDLNNSLSGSRHGQGCAGASDPFKMPSGSYHHHIDPFGVDPFEDLNKSQGSMDSRGSHASNSSRRRRSRGGRGKTDPFSSDPFEDLHGSQASMGSHTSNASRSKGRQKKAALDDIFQDFHSSQGSLDSKGSHASNASRSRRHGGARKSIQDLHNSALLNSLNASSDKLAFVESGKWMIEAQEKAVAPPKVQAWQKRRMERANG